MLFVFDIIIIAILVTEKDKVIKKCRSNNMFQAQENKTFVIFVIIFHIKQTQTNKSNKTQEAYEFINNYQ